MERLGHNGAHCQGRPLAGKERELWWGTASGSSRGLE